MPDRAGNSQYVKNGRVKVFVQSFGCRASQADGAAIEAAFKTHGCEITPQSGDAGLVVLNTCTVTASADLDVRRAIRNLHRERPGREILVTGCYAQRAPEELAQLPGVTWVIGNSHKHRIAELVLLQSREEYHGQVIAADMSGQTEFAASLAGDVREDRTRPNLKIQDGCSNRCSFCIIPSVRGRSRSAPADQVLAQVRDLAGRYCEIVLSGINLGRWGRDLAGSPRFTGLLQRIVNETAIRHLRISSVEPMDWTQELLELIASEPRIAKHVHLPLQSGCDAVLKRMFRKYRTRHYASRVELARKLMPDAAIGADVMTGFPGETDGEFTESLRFIEEQPFTYLHVFTYSERPGTAAAALPNPVPVPVRRERTSILRELSERKNREFRSRMTGKTIRAITLEQRGMALTTNFLKLEMAVARAPNQMLDFDIGGVTEAGLRERSAFPIL